jgi:CIC family chloride channel protein
MSVAVAGLHALLFNISIRERLSSQISIEPLRALLVPSLGGLLLGVAFLLLLRWRPAREIDPIEANALHGGRMSFRGSVIVALQTVWSSGVGASVGLEAGYTQLASGLAASLGRGFHLRRADQRIMVGCGAAAAISGAFGAPLAGAFYAFELVIGGYTPASLTPVGVAAVAGYFVTHGFAALRLGVGVGPVGDILGRDLAIAAMLGILAALFGIAIMRGVALCETLLSKTGLWPPLRPALGGLAVGLLALQTPQVMSSGHGALHFAGIVSMPLAVIATVFVLKAMASVISLGSGFRGGLFFATLLMGALGGRLFAAGIDTVWPGLDLDPNVYAIIGMSALSASVIGGPLTMSFIALESTGNLWLTTAVLVAVIISTQITRELFGYSFATWRLHLRGETIRSAADVGWIRDLTVQRLMRPDVTTVNADMGIEEFRGKFPLGSKTRVVAVDATGRYVGLALVAEAHAPDIEARNGLIDMLHHRDVVLHPVMNIQEAIAVFDAAEAESLVVVETGGEHRPVGILTEAHAMRRYAEESEQRRREAVGDI